MGKMSLRSIAFVGARRFLPMTTLQLLTIDIYQAQPVKYSRLYKEVTDAQEMFCPVAISQLYICMQMIVLKLNPSNKSSNALRSADQCRY